MSETPYIPPYQRPTVRDQQLATGQEYLEHDLIGEVDESAIQQEVVELLHSEDVQQGIQVVDSELAERVLQQEAAGNSARIVFHGVTPAGQAVAVMETTSPERDSERAWPSYDVMVYDIRNVTDEEFSAAIKPRQIAKKYDYGDNVDIFLKREDGSDYDVNDDKQYQERSQNRLLFSKDGRGAIQLGDNNVESFDEAAFGHRRKQAMHEQVAPLREAEARHLRNSDRANKESLSARSPMPDLVDSDDSKTRLTVERDDEWAKSQMMAERAREVIRTMKQNPEMLDRSDIIHDKHKAELVADAIKPLMDQAAIAKTDQQRDELTVKADALAKEVAKAYDADPAGYDGVKKETPRHDRKEPAGGLRSMLRSFGRRK